MGSNDVGTKSVSSHVHNYYWNGDPLNCCCPGESIMKQRKYFVFKSLPKLVEIGKCIVGNMRNRFWTSRFGEISSIRRTNNFLFEELFWDRIFFLYSSSQPNYSCRLTHCQLCLHMLRLFTENQRIWWWHIYDEFIFKVENVVLRFLLLVCQTSVIIILKNLRYVFCFFLKTAFGFFLSPGILL